MSSSSLESEDLVNVALVRMEDVQPSRNRIINSRTPSKDSEEVYETCIIDNIDYENECIVNDDDDSNIGSMVSLQSEEVYEEDSSNQEVIIPEVLEQVRRGNDKNEIEILLQNEHQDYTMEAYMKDPLESDLGADKFVELADSSLAVGTEACIVNNIVVSPQRVYKVNPKDLILCSPVQSTPQRAIEIEVPPNKVKKVDHVAVNRGTESWPTLEILPGGVIKNTDNYENDSYLYPDKVQESVANTGKMMYACAKCSQTFKYLFCLVKHVKWHEDQNKYTKDPKFGKMSTTLEQKIANLKRDRLDVNKAKKHQQHVLPSDGETVNKIRKVEEISDKI